MGTIVDTIGGYDPAYASLFTGQYTDWMPTTMPFIPLVPLAPLVIYPEGYIPPSAQVDYPEVSASDLAITPVSIDEVSQPQALQLEGIKAKSKERLEKQAERGKRATDIAQTRTVKTDAEMALIRVLDKEKMMYSFESELLNGRLDLQMLEAPFLTNGKVIRFFEQNNSEKAYEKVLLESMGLEVMDLAPSRFSGAIAIREVLLEIQRV